MSSFWVQWKKLPIEQRRVWTVVGSTIVLGSIFKVLYFNFSRGLMVEDSNRSHKDGVERLKEAKDYSIWSRKDREKRLPELTDEQRDQMREYLKLIQMHGLNKTAEFANNEKECEGCPIFKQGQKLFADRSASSTTNN